MSGETFGRFEDELYSTLFRMVHHGGDVEERLGGVADDRALVGSARRAETKGIKFANVLSNALKQCCVGDGRGGSSQFLGELAKHAPTLFYARVRDFFERVWPALMDARSPDVREAAARRSARLWRSSLAAPAAQHSHFCAIYAKAHAALAPTSTSDRTPRRFAVSVASAPVGRRRVARRPAAGSSATPGSPAPAMAATEATGHGALLAVGALLRHAGGFMMPRFRAAFREACDAAIALREHRSRAIRKAVTDLLPRLAQYCPDAFARAYLKGTTKHLLAMAVHRTSGELRDAAYEAMGRLALAVKHHLVPALPEIVATLCESGLNCPYEASPSLDASGSLGFLRSGAPHASDPLDDALLSGAPELRGVARGAFSRGRGARSRRRRRPRKRRRGVVVDCVADVFEALGEDPAAARRRVVGRPVRERALRPDPRSASSPSAAVAAARGAAAPAAARGLNARLPAETDGPRRPDDSDDDADDDDSGDSGDSDRGSAAAAATTARRRAVWPLAAEVVAALPLGYRDLAVKALRGAAPRALDIAPAPRDDGLKVPTRLACAALDALGECVLVLGPRSRVVVYKPRVLAPLFGSCSTGRRREARARARVLGRLASSAGCVVAPYLEHAPLLPRMLAVLCESSGGAVASSSAGAPPAPTSGGGAREAGDRGGAPWSLCREPCGPWACWGPGPLQVRARAARVARGDGQGQSARSRGGGGGRSAVQPKAPGKSEPMAIPGASPKRDGDAAEGVDGRDLEDKRQLLCVLRAREPVQGEAGVEAPLLGPHLAGLLEDDEDEPAAAAMYAQSCAVALPAIRESGSDPAPADLIHAGERGVDGAGKNDVGAYYEARLVGADVGPRRDDDDDFAGDAHRKDGKKRAKGKDRAARAATPAAGEDYYARVAIDALVRVLRDGSLAAHHAAVTQALMFIFQSLGLRGAASPAALAWAKRRPAGGGGGDRGGRRRRRGHAFLSRSQHIGEKYRASSIDHAVDEISAVAAGGGGSASVSAQRAGLQVARGRRRPGLGGGAAAEGPSRQRLHVNQPNLQRAWDVSQRLTADDWNDWLRRLSLELLRESPSAALRSCATVAHAYPRLSRQLFQSAFVSCWLELDGVPR
ncbi:phosphatidylinositol kinase [Aureococcus anophagefferens]|nr:phosphatidylinositol kinase [Aureococcus anophagefferens]